MATSKARFPIVCTAHTNVEILKSLLSHDELILIARKDLSELITGDDDDDKLAEFQPPFSQEQPQASQDLATFMKATKANSAILDHGFIILDATTATDGQTCQVGTDERSDADSPYGHYVAFRSNISSVVRGLQELQHSENPIQAVRRLRNESAMIGGVWDQELADTFRAKPEKLPLNQYPVHSDWDEFGNGDAPFYPIFLTAAHVKLETLNQLLKAMYNHDWGTEQEDEEDESSEAVSLRGPPVAFVTSVDKPPFYSVTTTGRPLDKPPNVPSELVGLSALDCDAIVRGRFPQQNSNLLCIAFIVVDDLTEKNKTVIIGGYHEDTQELVMTRSDFSGALITLVAQGVTSLNMELVCSEAVTEASGVATYSL